MYIRRAQLPVFGSFGAEDSGDLPVGSRIMLPAGALLKVRSSVSEGAEKPWAEFALPADGEAIVEAVTGVMADGPVIGRDVVSVGAIVTIATDTRIGGTAADIAARSLKDSSGRVDVVVPHDTRAMILEVASSPAPSDLPVPGSPIVGASGLTSTQEATNVTWAKRAIAGGVVASIAATTGVAGATVLAVNGRKKAAITAGVAGLAVVVVGVSVAVFSARRIVHPTVV